MKFQVYDSATRKKQPLLADGQRELGIYVCGPTVYDHIHIGNARTWAMFQAFVNYLRFCDVQVHHVVNVTDVNDKIYAAAAERGIASSDLARQATEWYRADTDRLGLGRPDDEPLASEAIDGMIAMIQTLIERDLAYESGGDVYFRVERADGYGKLSNRQLDEMVAGSRDDLEPAAGKQHPLDFALWKATKDGEDTDWPSPWGAGRPGWHIECSAMAREHLGDSFDVHAGGLDLIFPHHENEVAQSRGAGHDFARLWMHGGMLQLDGEKMAKSEGNIAKLVDVLDRYPAWAVLLFFYSALYRNPLDYSDEALDAKVAEGSRITEALRRSERFLASVETRNVGDHAFADSSREWSGMHEALHDDFNTPNALSELYGLVYDLNTAVDEHATPQIVRNLRKAIVEFLDVFGLTALLPGEVDVSSEAAELMRQRDAAREAKDWEESDRLRAELEAMGYVVRDTSGGTELLSGDDDEHDDGDGDGDGEEDSDLEAVATGENDSGG